GADARDHGVDAALGVVPVLLGGGAAMYIDVGGVVELLALHRAGLLGDLLGLLDGALHALGGLGEHQLGPEGAQQHPPLLGHGLGHRQNDLVAAGGADHRERDTGVSAGGLDDGAPGPERSGLLGGVDHGHADAVLDRVRG